MKYRKIIGNNISLSEIGFGAWGIGGITSGSTSYGNTDDNVSKLALLEAYKRGVNYFDTSNVYGAGKSEQLIGETFEKYRENVVYSTKVGLLSYDKPGNYNVESMLESLLCSLDRLRTKYIDILYLHNMPIDNSDDCKQIVDFFNKLKIDKTVLATGFSALKPEDGLIAIDKIQPDVIQVNYNLTDYRALDVGLVGKAKINNTSLVVRTPLSAGFLTGTIGIDEKFNNSDHRSRINHDMRKEWLSMSDKMKEFINIKINETSAIMSLRFCLSLDNVVSVIPGMITPEHVVENIKASDFGVLPKGILNSLEDIYRSGEKQLEMIIKGNIHKLTDGKH